MLLLLLLFFIVINKPWKARKGNAEACECGIQNKSQLIKQQTTLAAEHDDDDDDVIVDSDANSKYIRNGWEFLRLK